MYREAACYQQEDNNKRLDEMRQIVDEKLQRTINERATQSFQMVNDRLEQVYKGLGDAELSRGRTWLKGLKTPAYWRDTAYAILKKCRPEQHVENVVTPPRARSGWNSATKIPGDDDGSFAAHRSKISCRRVQRPYGAYDSADPARVDAAGDA